MATTPKVQTVSGDAAGGWLVELHDGDTFRCYSPAGETTEAAEAAALEMWTKEFAPKEPDRQDGADRNSITMTVVLGGSAAIASPLKIGDADVPVEQIIASAFRSTGLTIEAWNALTEAERDAHLALDIADRRAALEPKKADA